jgi:Raf kinase inhibitor-like YbhB/YbcL family protein
MTGDLITDGSGNPPGGGSARIWLIVLAGVLVLAAVVAIVVAVSGGDSEDSATTDIAGTTAPNTEPDATTPDASAPETPAPETTAQDTTPPEATPSETTPSETTPSETTPPETTAPPDNGLEFTIEGIEDGGEVPESFTCDGANQAPLVMVDSLPGNTQQLALIVDDPDAPSSDPFVHWLVYGISPTTTLITDGVDEFTYGLNDVQLLDWFGPCPPPGDGPHRYFFTLYSLTGALELEAGLDGRELFEIIEPLIQAETELVATYER